MHGNLLERTEKKKAGELQIKKQSFTVCQANNAQDIPEEVVCRTQHSWMSITRQSRRSQQVGQELAMGEGLALSSLVSEKKRHELLVLSLRKYTTQVFKK